jgi:hypothetical protein
VAGVSTCNFHVDAVFLCLFSVTVVHVQANNRRFSLSHTYTNARAKADTVQPD